MGTRGWFQRSGSSSFELLSRGWLGEKIWSQCFAGYILFSAFNCFSVLLLHSVHRGGVLEDTFWSPSPQSFKFSKIAVLGSRTAVFLESLKFCRSFFVEKLVFLGDFLILFFEITWKNFNLFFLNTWKKILKTVLLLSFFGGHLRLCPCPRKGLSSKELSLAQDIFLCPWPRALCPRLHLCPVSV